MLQEGGVSGFSPTLPLAESPEVGFPPCSVAPCAPKQKGTPTAFSAGDSRMGEKLEAPFPSLQGSFTAPSKQAHFEVCFSTVHLAVSLVADPWPNMYWLYYVITSWVGLLPMQSSSPHQCSTSPSNQFGGLTKHNVKHKVSWGKPRVSSHWTCDCHWLPNSEGGEWVSEGTHSGRRDFFISSLIPIMLLKAEKGHGEASCPGDTWNQP